MNDKMQNDKFHEIAAEAYKNTIGKDNERRSARSLPISDTMLAFDAAHAAIDTMEALKATDSKAVGFPAAYEAANENARALTEAMYALPVITVEEKRKMAGLILRYDGEGLEPAVAIALRSIADENREPKRTRTKNIKSNVLKALKVSDGRPIGEVKFSELVGLAEQAEARAQQARAAMTILRPQSTQLA